MARGDDRAALRSFEAELALEANGHLYARECCANTWYAAGALHLHRGQTAEARAAFEQAVARVATHALAGAALATICDPNASDHPAAHSSSAAAPSVDAALAEAVRHALRGDHQAAAGIVDRTLAAAPEGTSAGWVLPVEPILRVWAHPDIWAPVLTRLRTRAA
jgi:hypothetical protein